MKSRGVLTCGCGLREDVKKEGFVFALKKR